MISDNSRAAECTFYAFDGCNEGATQWLGFEKVGSQSSGLGITFDAVF